MLTALGMLYLAKNLEDKTADQRMMKGAIEEEIYAALEAEVDADIEEAARELRALQMSRIRQIEEGADSSGKE